MWEHKKSPVRGKKGFALATVIVVSCVIVILATSLIGIAMISTQNTSGNIDERQAYLNAKSALDYGAAYYGDGTTLPTLASGATTAEEYLLMRDVDGGTSEMGADVAPISADTSGYKTYVYTLYDKTQATLTLRAYAQSSSALSKATKSTTLSVTYKIGTGSSQIGHHIPTTPVRTTHTRSNDDVTIHVRRDPNATGDDYFNPAIYTWAYFIKNPSRGIDYTSHVSWADANQTITTQPVDFMNDFSASDLNNIEYERGSNTNKFEPAGRWLTAGTNGSGVSGPATKMDQTIGSTDWFEHTFSPSKMAEAQAGSGARMTPWFSMIVSRQGMGVDIGNKADGTQSCEFLNVWYLDNDDRNIYVEILQSPLYYYKNRNWDGKTNLEGRLIAYCNAPQTVYFVKKTGVNDNTLSPSISGHSMTYCGYGWWIYRDANAGGSGGLGSSVNITTSGSTTTVTNIRKGSDNTITKNSAYIVIDASGNARSFVSEEAAALYTGDQDYVTVYAKAYKNDSISQPKISYLVETHSDSAAKRKLKEAIDSADLLYMSDYTEESWDNFVAVLNAAKAVYNEPDLKTNSEYNTQTSNILEAIKNLVFKPVDTTKLEQLIAEADSKVKEDYTTESYAPMVTVRNQAQKLVERAKAVDGSVNQADIETKCAALRSKIDALEDIQSYRDLLNSKIAEAQTTIDSNPGSPALPELQNALNTAKGLTGSNSKTEIENAVTNLLKAINKVRNLGDLTLLEEAIANANRIIDNDSSSLVAGTLKNLKNVVSVAQNAMSTNVLTQEEVDSYVAAINDAINKLIYIPEDNLKLASGKKRVWFDLSALGNSDNYYIYAWYGEGGPGKQNTAFLNAGEWSRYPSLKLTHDAATGYYYYDLDEKYTNMIIVRNSDNVQTQDLNYNAKTNFIIIKGPKGASSPTYAMMATVFVEVSSPWGGSAQYAYVTSSGTSSLNTKNLTADKFNVKDGSGKYYVKRVAFDNKSKFYVHNGNNTGNSRTVDITLKPESFLVLYTDKSLSSSANVAVNADTLKNIMNSEPVTNLRVSAKANVTAANYTGGSANVVKTASGTFTDSAVPDEPTITLYFKKPSGWSKEVAAELCQLDDSNAVVDGTLQGNLRMVTTDESYYSIKLDSSRVNAITVSDATSGSRKTSRLKLAKDASGKYYNIQLIGENSSGFEIKMYTAAQATVSTADVTFSDNNLSMAFIGGKKQVFNNKADTRSGRKDMCGNGLYSGALFSNTNDEGYARVGMTSTSTYYDWYAYKIPAGDSDLYTFAIAGLNKSSSSTSTKQIHQVWGDVWVTLTSNAQKDGGKYKVLINTANPEDNISQEKTTVYFAMNTDLISNHGGMQVTMWGTESKTVKLEDTYEGYYYVEIPQDMPFLQVSSVDSMVVYEKTKLQGGDKILYDYSAGAGGTPTWLTYVPANIALQRARASAEAVGRGWIIYDYSASVPHNVTNTYQPKFLENIADKDSSDNQTSDPAHDRARANYLAEETEAYQELYNAISRGRTYLTKDDAGNPVWYPESADDTTGISYTADTVRELYIVVRDAVNSYGDPSGITLDYAVNTAKLIDERIDELVADITGEATLLLEDAAGWGSNIVVRYTDSAGITSPATAVTMHNTAGNPMVYVPADPQITNVQFGNGTVWGSAQPVVKFGEEWVYNNSPDPIVSGWSLNNAENYFYLTFTERTQNSVSDEMNVGEGATADDFVLYFKHNVTVKYKESAGMPERTYIIPAGAYAINITNYRSYYTGAGSPPDKVNLYSRTAEDYFTNLENQGMSPTGADSDSLLWTNGGNIVYHSALLQTSGDVNFIASSGSLNGSYSVTDGFYFRWNGTSDFVVNSGTVISAASYTFASPMRISGGSTIAPTFTLKNNSTDPNAKIVVTFLTDTDVYYKDVSGADVEFTIYQGTYEVVNPGDVNFFDWDLWKSGVRVVDASGIPSGGGFLTDPYYSTE